MTLSGVILGTAAVTIDQEQAKGHDADPRSDVFAFGAVLDQTLTGRRAFAGEGVSETLAFVITRDPSSGHAGRQWFRSGCECCYSPLNSALPQRR